MLVDDKYELGALIRAGAVTTFEARDIALDRNVYIHLMPLVEEPDPDQIPLFDRVRTYLSEKPADTPVIAHGEYGGTPFVVTEAKPELLNLQRWMDKHAPSIAATKEAPAEPAPQPAAPLPANKEAAESEGRTAELSGVSFSKETAIPRAAPPRLRPTPPPNVPITLSTPSEAVRVERSENAAAEPKPSLAATIERPVGSAVSDRRPVYLLLAVLFCALLVSACGILLWVLITSEPGQSTAILDAPPASVYETR